LLEEFGTTTTRFEKMWRERSQVFDHILKVEVSRILILLAEKVEIDGELKQLEWIV
jgi:hypothetical protein